MCTRVYTGKKTSISDRDPSNFYFANASKRRRSISANRPKPFLLGSEKRYMHVRGQAELTSETVETLVRTYRRQGLVVPGGRRRSRGGALRRLWCPGGGTCTRRSLGVRGGR